MFDDKENVKVTRGCRWDECFQMAVDSLGGGKEVLFEDAYADWQGYLDMDVLLHDGRVVSYYYSYGSCSGCDPWEGEFSYDTQEFSVSQVMLDEMTIFTDRAEYDRWVASLPSGKREGHMDRY